MRYFVVYWVNFENADPNDQRIFFDECIEIHKTLDRAKTFADSMKKKGYKTEIWKGEKL